MFEGMVNALDILPAGWDFLDGNHGNKWHVIRKIRSRWLGFFRFGDFVFALSEAAIVLQGCRSL